MENDPRARELLLQHGVREIPALAKGGRFVVAKNLDLVAKFLGLHGSGHVPLPPEALFRKWVKVLSAAQRYVRQIPDDQMILRATKNRGRPLAVLCHHIFSIGDALLECAVSGASNLDGLTTKSLAPGAFGTGEEIARHGDEVIARLERWWNELDDRTCARRMEIANYGVISVHQMLERGTWHSAHHARQLADVLDRQGITPDGKLTAGDLAGLPLPERIWE